MPLRINCEAHQLVIYHGDIEEQNGLAVVTGSDGQRYVDPRPEYHTYRPPWFSEDPTRWLALSESTPPDLEEEGVLRLPVVRRLALNRSVLEKGYGAHRSYRAFRDRGSERPDHALVGVVNHGGNGLGQAAIRRILPGTQVLSHGLSAGSGSPRTSLLLLRPGGAFETLRPDREGMRSERFLTANDPKKGLMTIRSELAHAAFNKGALTILDPNTLSDPRD